MMRITLLIIAFTLLAGNHTMYAVSTHDISQAFNMIHRANNIETLATAMKNDDLTHWRSLTKQRLAHIQAKGNSSNNFTSTIARKTVDNLQQLLEKLDH